jgi:hypothetical protein
VRWRRWLADLVLILAAVISLVFEPLSIAIHSVIGLMFAAAVGPHLWYRRNWIRATLRRAARRRPLPARRRWALLQAASLAVLVIVMTGTGLYDWLATRTKIRWHAISAVILIAVMIRHAWPRRNRLLPARRGQSRP